MGKVDKVIRLIMSLCLLCLALIFTYIFAITEPLGVKGLIGEVALLIIFYVGFINCFTQAIRPVKRINSQILELNDKSNISDGSHTFGELYWHRMILFSVICNQNQEKAWKSKLHDDGTMYDNYFIVGIATPEGDYTYHYHMENWGYFNVKEIEKAPKWDGHKPEDITRLFSLLE